jgi:integrase
MQAKLKLVDTTKLQQAENKTVKLQKGLQIYTRNLTPNWWVRVNVKGQKALRVSCETTDFETAKNVAYAKLAEVQHKIDQQYAVHEKSFTDVANNFLAHSKMRVDSGKLDAKTYSGYVSAIRNYLLPYFAKKEKLTISRLNRVAIVNFQSWRIDNGLHSKPSTSTLNKEEGILSKMLDFAVDKGYITQKPNMKKTAIIYGRHPAFEKRQFKLLMRKMKVFTNASPNSAIKRSRSNMYSAIMILVKTGMRPHELLPDTEKQSKGLRWCDIELCVDKETQKKYVKIKIVKANSKTVERTVFADATAHCHFKRLQEKADARWSAIEKIFDTDYRRPFKSFLTWANMRANADGENYCFYSMRHTFATWKIEEGVSIQQLATVMGNSPQIINKHYCHAQAENFKKNFI